MKTVGKAAQVGRAQDHGHIRALDGIRGFALLLVVAYHEQRIDPYIHWNRHISKAVATGWIGVDIFFVLSGFLITGILLNAREAHNYFKVFYARRCLRILPLYYLVLIASLLTQPGHFSFSVQIFFWLNLSNLSTAFSPYAIPFLAHFWSLAIEEQFYFVWPAIVRWLSPVRLAFVCVCVIAGLLVVRNVPAVLSLQSRWPELIYRLTPFRVDTLCGGALVAVAVKLLPDLERFRPWFRAVAVCSAIVFILTGFGRDHDSIRLIRFGYTALVLFSMSLVALSLYPHGLTSRLFSNPFLRKTGKYSYCFYLIHTFVLAFAVRHHRFVLRSFSAVRLAWLPNQAIALITFGVTFAAIFGICAASWNLFEGPILRLKRHVRYEPPLERTLA